MYVCHYDDIILVNSLILLVMVMESLLHPPLFQDSLVQADKQAKYNLNRPFNGVVQTFKAYISIFNQARESL